MKNYIKTLKYAKLFENINENQIESMLKCLNATTKSFHKNSVIILMDDEVKSVGIILSGTALIVKEDYLGNKNIITEVTEGQLFAETIVCAGLKKSPVTVETLTGCDVLFIDYKKIVHTCSSACSFHNMLIENMIKVIAEKNLMLNQKLEYVSKGTTKDKLMMYLNVQAKKNNSKKFSIPFSRNELADFLCVDRSAMSRELCRLRDEGLIGFNKNSFEIFD